MPNLDDYRPKKQSQKKFWGHFLYLIYAIVTQNKVTAMHHLFSYGSNNTRQLAERVGRVDPPFRAVKAVLPEHVRIFAGFSSRWNGAPASVYPRSSSFVTGTVVEISEEELLKLDTFETGYTRVQKVVYLHTLPNVPVTAHIYVKNEHYHKEALPSQSYLHAIHSNIEESCIPIYVVPTGHDSPVLAAIWEKGCGVTKVQAIEH
jgi:gamma-glutamylcyclotransferase (GGCT)/AIG2-like uncharacterized protein YtfP